MAKQRAVKVPRLNFPVTAEMIEKAIPEDSSHCMIADALRAARPDARAVAVDLATIRFTDPKTRRRLIYLTPIPAQIALLKFDDGQIPEPFQLQAMAAQVIEPKPKAEDSPSSSQKGQRKPRRAHVRTSPKGSKSPPVKVNGQAPPIGPMARGMGTATRVDPRSMTGRTRKFGLKAMGRAKV